MFETKQQAQVHLQHLKTKLENLERKLGQLPIPTKIEELSADYVFLAGEIEEMEDRIWEMEEIQGEDND